MSEYQWVHFLAVDQPLNDKQLEYMEQQSSRAHISRHEFTNEYHYGSFRGSAKEMLRRGYDVHLHFANYGVRKLMFRLPHGLPCDKKAFAAYCPDFGVGWHADQSERGGILEVYPEGDGRFYDYVDDVPGLIQKIAPIRELLMQGDLRPLYIAWLATILSFDDEEHEPPVPAGLDDLPECLEAMAEFYEISTDLIAAAAQCSEPAPDQDGSNDQTLQDWLAEQSVNELRELVQQLLSTEATRVRANVIEQMRKRANRPAWPVTKSNRTLGELRRLAESLSVQRLEQEQVQKNRARKKRLTQLAADPLKVIEKIEAWVKESSSISYAKAASELADLREALGPDLGPAETNAIAERLRKKYPTRRALISSFQKQNFLVKKKK